MASSSILPTLFAGKGSSNWISRKGDSGSSNWISLKAAAGSSISICRKAAAGSSIFISGKAAAGAANLFGGCGARINAMSVSDESVLCPSSLPSKISPWLMLPPAVEGGDRVYKFYSLAENKVLSLNKRGGGGEEELELPDDEAEVVGSSHGWLAYFNKRNYDLFISNPLSGRHIKLPPIHTLPITQVKLRGEYPLVSKVVISCSPDEEECRAMMIFGQANRLAFCLPGRSTEWTPIGALFLKEETPFVKFARVYEDFVYSSRHKLFTCVTQFNMEDWDLQDPRSPRIDWMENEEDKLKFDFENRPWWEDNADVVLELCRDFQYLVFAEQSNELFLVNRYVMERSSYFKNNIKYHLPVRGWDDSYPYKTIGFDVQKVDREGGKLKYMEGSLDGLVMFIGTNHSFAMSAAEFPELNPNSIYFTDANELTPPDWHTYGGHDIGIYNFESKTFYPCYYPCDVQSIKRNVNVPPPVWFTPSPH